MAGGLTADIRRLRAPDSRAIEYSASMLGGPHTGSGGPSGPVCALKRDLLDARSREPCVPCDLRLSPALSDGVEHELDCATSSSLRSSSWRLRILLEIALSGLRARLGGPFRTILDGVAPRPIRFRPWTCGQPTGRHPVGRKTTDKVPFEDYGLTAEDYRAWHAAALGRGPAVSPDIDARVMRWHHDKKAREDAAAATRAERKRRLWYATSSLLGVASIVAVTVAVVAERPVHVSNQTDARLYLAALVAGLAAFLGRDWNRKP